MISIAERSSLNTFIDNDNKWKNDTHEEESSKEKPNSKDSVTLSGEE